MRYDLTYSFNLYNTDGELYESCVMLHLGNGIILQFEDLESYDKFILDMAGMRKEMQKELKQCKIIK